jgi:hypothetical protein
MSAFQIFIKPCAGRLFMNHYYDVVAMSKLATMEDGRVFTKKEAERITTGAPSVALEAFVREADGLTCEYIARTTECSVIPQKLDKIEFWKEYFWKYAQQKERKGAYDRQELLNATLRAVRLKTSGERGTDFDYMLCRTLGLFRFMLGGKID